MSFGTKNLGNYQNYACSVTMHNKQLIPSLNRDIFHAKSYNDNPYDLFHQLRTLGRIHKFNRLWLVSRHEDCISLLKDKRIGRQSDEEGGDINQEEFPLFHSLSYAFGMMDPPEHTRVRGVFREFFTRDYIEHLTPVIQREAGLLLDSFPQNGQVDVVKFYAEALPFRIISAMIGIPASYETDLICWVHNFRKGFEAVLPPINREIRRLADEAATNIRNMYLALIDEKRRQPGHDLISHILPSLDTKVLSLDEAIGGLSLMLPAGTQTTLQSISNGILCLLQNPRQLELFKQQSDRDRYQSVEEILRYESPVKSLMRSVKEDFLYCGLKLRAGEKVCFLYASANRDEEVFEDAEAFKLDRDCSKQLAFSAGPHHCLGIHLGRIEVKIALQMIFERYPHCQLLESEPSWENSFFSRQLNKLLIKLG